MEGIVTEEELEVQVAPDVKFWAPIQLTEAKVFEVFTAIPLSICVVKIIGVPAGTVCHVEPVLVAINAFPSCPGDPSESNISPVMWMSSVYIIFVDI